MDIWGIDYILFHFVWGFALWCEIEQPFISKLQMSPRRVQSLDISHPGQTILILHQLANHVQILHNPRIFFIQIHHKVQIRLIFLIYLRCSLILQSEEFIPFIFDEAMQVDADILAYENHVHEAVWHVAVEVEDPLEDF